MRPQTSLRTVAAALLVLPLVLVARPSGAGAEPPAPEAVVVVNAPGSADTDVVAATLMTNAVSAATDAAVRTLAGHVTRSSHPDALRKAFHAYFSYRSANPSLVRKPYLYFVDLGLDNRTARGYVFDMEQLKLVDGPFTVAHGRGSSRARNAVPRTFSNRPGSAASSLGLYLAQETYTFTGKLAGRRYSSVGLRMRGESGEFNSAARPRGVVAHGAPYVNAREAGRSEGCPAMEQHRAKRLLPLLADGGVVFIYSPNDARWLREDRWLNAVATQ